MKIIVTGFDPFGGESINPAFEAVKLIPDQVAGADIIKVEIPTVFGRCGDVLKAAVEEHRPDAVLCVGQAGGRSTISVEKVAVNLDEARIPDNDGQQPLDTPIKEDGPTAYFSKLPVKAMVKNVLDQGIPSSISYTAGTYVCNDIMYRLLYMIDKEYPSMRGGFIHVPFATQQAIGKPEGTPSMPVQTIAAGLTYAVEAIVKHEEDIEGVGGATH